METVEELKQQLKASEEELERLRAQMSREVNIVADIIAERDNARKQAAAMREAIPFPTIVASNAASIAWHVEQGEAFGGLTLKGLSSWLRSVSEDYQKFITAQIGLTDTKCRQCGAVYAPTDDDNGLCVKCSLKGKADPAALRERAAWERDAKEAP